MNKEYSKTKTFKKPSENGLNNQNLNFENSDIKCIAYYDSYFTAVKKGEYSLPSVATFTDVKYTPANYPAIGVTRLLDAEIGIYVNKCLAEGKKISIPDFIKRYNERYSAAAKLVSIGSIELSRRKIDEFGL